MTHSPPATRDSLLARATRLPASQGADGGGEAGEADYAVQDDVRRRAGELLGRAGTGEDFGAEALQGTGFARFQGDVLGPELGRLAWRAYGASLPAERPTTSKRSGYLRTTSRACLPMLPVEPRMVRRRLMRVFGPISYE